MTEAQATEMLALLEQLTVYEGVGPLAYAAGFVVFYIGFRIGCDLL